MSSCNSRLKFASLDRLAVSLGCEKVATGHYARVEFDPVTNRYKLLRGKNEQKDQSYFLWELTQAQLSRALFPLGEMSKPEARDAARQHGLSRSCRRRKSRRRSVLCLTAITQVLSIVISKRRTQPIVCPVQVKSSTPTGVIGSHEGIHRYTIGQRRGIGIADERPLYVISIDADRNRVTAGSSEELLSNEFTAAV